ncbi:hypothetical protein INR49_010254 [Caranx melampygus]|nr:hypothetical protein INR49_010254 [Caranx melampygus]
MEQRPALVAMAAELVQDQLSLTRRVGEPVSFSCEGTDSVITVDVWAGYQKKEHSQIFLIFTGKVGK